MKKLMKFTSKIQEEKTTKASAAASVTAADGERGSAAAARAQEAYHGQVLERDDDEEREGEGEGEGGEKWHTGKLKFRKHIDDAYRNASTSTSASTSTTEARGGDGRRMSDYVVSDPRQAVDNNKHSKQ